MIEMKFGRKVIAWENNVDPVKGRYLIYQSHGQAHWILCDDGTITPFKHAEPDPEGAPMNGDEVECSNDGVTFTNSTDKYIGLQANGRHAVELGNTVLTWNHVRFPQPSKRDRVEEFLNSYYYPCNAEKIADQIDKIYTDGKSWS